MNIFDWTLSVLGVIALFVLGYVVDELIDRRRKNKQS
jgi:hypothetical protein